VVVRQAEGASQEESIIKPGGVAVQVTGAGADGKRNGNGCLRGCLPPPHFKEIKKFDFPTVVMRLILYLFFKNKL
jgi:hypothetical protein